jgi:hypothetical protein
LEPKGGLLLLTIQKQNFAQVYSHWQKVGWVEVVVQVRWHSLTMRLVFHWLWPAERRLHRQDVGVLRAQISPYSDSCCVLLWSGYWQSTILVRKLGLGYLR